MKSNLIFPYALRETLNLTGMGVALFWSAGRLDWWQGWGAMAVMLGWMVATAWIVTRLHPGLLAERLLRTGARRWDTTIVALVGLIQLLRYIAAGLDVRNGWSGAFSPAVQGAALVMCALSYALFTWATASNAFYSQIVKIQTERGHTVVRGGPYHIIRHPGYLGAIIYELMVPILLGSWPAFAISLVSAGLFVLRTALEDRTLQAELPGYTGYAREVRYRLIPEVW